MLFVSDTAKERIQQIITDNSYDENYFIRVSVLGGGCSGLTYQMDFDNKIKEEDQIFNDKGIKLVTDLRSFLYICNTTLDFSEGLNGKGFHFVNPNAQRTCSCGDSFAI
ncbi:MAG: iron-sulfur cluster assembly accessory protein [Chitinophagales bacterium]|nr:iron-sulfur cluster assembly accessory protein [Chitinophagales bacterium]